VVTDVVVVLLFEISYWLVVIFPKF